MECHRCLRAGESYGTSKICRGCSASVNADIERALTEGRRLVAADFGIPATALRCRVHTIRRALEVRNDVMPVAVCDCGVRLKAGRRFSGVCSKCVPSPGGRRVKAAIAICALLSGCGFLVEDFAQPRRPDMVSACGAKVYASTADVDLSGYQEAEDRAVSGLAGVFGPAICKAFNGWQVTVRHEASGKWVDQWGRTVGGLSGCDASPGVNGWAVVLDDWHELSFFHEAAHRQECPTENAAHEGWGDPADPGSIFGAIRTAAASGPRPVVAP